MLTSVYHPIDKHRVVDQDEAERLLLTGVWFDCPKKARDYKDKVEQEIKAEDKAETKAAKKPKEVITEVKIVKTEEKQDER